MPIGRCLYPRAGKIIDGDAVLLLTARILKERGELAGKNGHPVVVATVMSNLGLERALRSHGIEMIRTPVGDKYVLEEMLAAERGSGRRTIRTRDFSPVRHHRRRHAHCAAGF